VLLAILGASPVAKADDLIEREALAEKLAALTPYTSQDYADEQIKILRRLFGDELTLYALGETRSAAQAAFAAVVPSRNEQVKSELAAELTADELMEAITYLRSPLVQRLDEQHATFNAEKDSARRQALRDRLFTRAEQIELNNIVSAPGVAKYVTTTLMAETDWSLSADKLYLDNLRKRCAGRTAPLPWCK